MRDWKDCMIGLEREPDEYEPIQAPFGLSGSKLIGLKELRSGKLFVLKYLDPTLSEGHRLIDQVKLGAALEELYSSERVPRVIAHNDEAIFMTHEGTHTLREAVLGTDFSPSTLEGVVSWLTEEVARVWRQSKQAYTSNHPAFARDPLARAKRIQTGVYGFAVEGGPLARYERSSLVVNGTELPFNIHDLFARIPGLYKPPAYLITCHGDLSGDNVRVDQKGRWWLIDPEWFGLHDWRVALTFMLDWWRSNASRIVQDGEISIAPGKIEISYEVRVDSAVEALIQAAWKLAARMATEFGEEAGWRNQLMLQSGLFYLGELRFVEQRGRQAHAPALLGQGLVALSSLLNK